MQRYNPKDIEPKWQKTWTDNKTFQATNDADKPKKFIIDMFPYPSGAAMHVGHVRNFTISDVLSQFHRQKGYNVLHTMGWDTFGLPAENYAIKTGTPPAETTKANVANFKHQLQQLGMSYDWSREINTSDPEYYRWTQWIFTQLFNKDLAYQKESAQWWCPHDKTVLANEQVESGRCWRCGNEVVKKNLKQWFFKTTAYADALLDGIDDLDWPEKIKTMQRNWIGRSRGAEVDFAVDGHAAKVKVFTTRPDTIFGATFLVLAPEHELVTEITSDAQKSEVDAYVKAAQKKSEIERQESKEKTGVFTGGYAVNPANNQKIPVWIADYVLGGYGTGAIMAVPAHDERDHGFAKKFDLPIVEVVEPETGEPQQDPEFRRSIVAIVHNPKTDEYLTINWGKQGGRLFIGGGRDENEDIVAASQREVAEETGYTNLKLVSQTGKIHHHYFAYSKNVARTIEVYGLYFELVDETRNEQKLEADEQGKFIVEWVSRARAEREVTEALHATCYKLLVKGENYHGEGRMVNSGQYDGRRSEEVREQIVADLAKAEVATERVQYKIRDWLISRQRYWGAPIPIIHCGTDGAVAVPEADLPVLLPEVQDFAPTGEGSALAGVTDWVNTTCPKCGGPAKRETDTMDGYACSSWYFLRYADPHNAQRAWDPKIANYWLPVDYYCGGDHAVSHLLYTRFWFHFFADQGLIEKSRREPVGKLVYNGYILAPDGRKMSKSLGNTVNPDDLIEQGYGADSLRLFEMFIAPYDQNTSWNTSGVPGTYRFLRRIWTLTQEFLASHNEDGPKVTEAELQRTAHQTIKKVTYDLENLSFNTAVAALMECVNELYKLKEKDHFASRDAWRFAIESLLQLLAPYAPHMSEELWQQLGHTDSIHLGSWPTHDEAYLTEDTATVAVQINGKVRSQITLAKDADETTAVDAAKADAKVQTHLTDKQIVKTIYVPGKILNLVVK